VYHGNFDYSGSAGLVFSGSTYVLGNFTFTSSNANFVTFSYNSYLRIQGTAVFDDAATWKILVTPTEGRDLWRHRTDRNISYVQAYFLKYNAHNVRTVSSDTCTRIFGTVKTVNSTNGHIFSQTMVVEFTDFKTYATCRIWWVIPLVFILVAAIIGIALFCYFRGRNKQAEEEAYIPVTDHEQHGFSDQDLPETYHHSSYGTTESSEQPIN
jgi:cbb3-type cytochrome oxidase subunit 3